MTALETKDFAEFFSEVHGYAPFIWQQRLVDFVAERGAWPEHIDAPTGAGKTAVIDVHIFVNALRRCGVRAPRRLVLTVNRRALVDSQYAAAELLLQKVTAAEPGTTCAAVREALSSGTGATPFLLTSLRGGSAGSSLSRADWRNDPVATQVICATPDMFGSRLLFRGYGTSRAARPIEAGLLAFDTVAVVDEAHLSRQLVATARRVSELAALPSKIAVPPLQVVATTATQAGSQGTTVEIAEADLQESPVLAARMTQPKPVTILTTSDRDRVETVAEATLQALAELGPSIGCVVNNVKTALAVQKVIRARSEAHCALRVGPMRSFEQRTAIRSAPEDPGVVIDGESAPIDILIATQTVEVGVDIDLRGLVTELASGSAIAQRAGRVNRRGALPSGPVWVVVADELKARLPYTELDLQSARGWLQSLPAETGLAPWSLRQIPPPVADPSRPVFQRLELWDADYLRHTSGVLHPETRGADLGLWLRDDLAESADVTVVVRGGLPSDDVAAAKFLALTPVHPLEAIPASLRTLQTALGAWLNERRAFVDGEGGWHTLEDPAQVAPGATVVVPTDAPIFHSGVVVDADFGGEPVRDVWRACQTLDGGFALAITTEADGGTKCAESVRADAQRLLADSEREDPVDRLGSISDALTMLKVEVPTNLADYVVDVGVYEDAVGCAQAMLVVQPLRSAVVERNREVAGTGRDFVLLDDHQSAVADRATTLATAVGLPASLIEAVRLAGLVHDEGKRDSRFQQLLMLVDSSARLTQSTDEHFVLAKSRYRSSTKEREFRSQESLGGWRHEQRSAAHAWATIPASSGRDLVARLAGTTHGHGRSSFAHDARTLLPDPSTDPALRYAAEKLFDLGLWESLVDGTDLEFGIWGCAYLEAILRAADVQISSEGS